MERTYTVALDKGALGPRRDLLLVGFATQTATNETLVVDAQAAMKELAGAGNLQGELLAINGPASMPVSFVLAHAVAHVYGAVAVFDPKRGGYIVAVSHHPDYPVGTLIAEESKP